MLACVWDSDDISLDSFARYSILSVGLSPDVSIKSVHFKIPTFTISAMAGFFWIAIKSSARWRGDRSSVDVFTSGRSARAADAMVVSGTLCASLLGSVCVLEVLVLG